ncbi:hypothetical protein [Amaricoccus solimangrovi]|uniref:Uncharacterized protein n=1 Tax=Amaricoccus solimangrovi TaxID=2589815 RepID=A0A501WGP1_9RHOB|nr:hypothetical protein [Amaricoccus solimangrovi]TPE47224.1 hypothetical protein FJM51_20430 [Amaricoccus solimangrovi]
MALEFPLGRDVFARKLRVREMTFWRRDFVETSGTGRGDIIVSEIAPPKWIADVTLARYNNRDADELQALFEAILPHRLFHLYNIRRPFPAADPDGSELGNSAPLLHAIGSDNVSLRISGLPSGYTLTRGDMLAFNRGDRRSLHRIIDTVSANSSGLTPSITVTPALKTGTVTGVRVFLERPTALMMIAPGSFAAGVTRKMLSDGCSFQAIEASV